MKIFLSQSGSRSLGIAELLKHWLPKVIQSLKPWLSDVNVEKGQRWNEEIGASLGDVQFGVICLTRANLHRPWLLFEAGALSKSLRDEARVVPLLIDFPQSDLQGPLSQFQASTLSRKDMFHLVQTINGRLESKLDENLLNDSFDRWWSDFEQKSGEIISSTSADNEGSKNLLPERSQSELFDELLVLARTNAQELVRLHAALGPSGEIRRDSRGWMSKSHTLEQLSGCGLSPRESEVALLVLDGLSNKMVARELSISEGTVKDHLQGVFEKLGIRSRTELPIRIYGPSKTVD